MSPRFGRRTPSPDERAAVDEAAKRYELDERPFGTDEETVRETGQFAEQLQERGFPVSTAMHPGPIIGTPERAESYAVTEGFVDRSETVPALAETDAPVPRWRQMLEVFFANKLAVASVAVLTFIVLACFVGPHIYQTNQTNAEAILSSTPNLPPSAAHPLGTDGNGWDVLGRIMYAGQYSLTLGLLAGVITIIVGTVYGMVSGFFGGVTDSVMMRFIDAALAIPYLFLLVALVTIFGNGTVFLILVIGLTGWFPNSRIIRGDALVIRELDYSVAATAMGATKRHVIGRHVFPNSISNIVTVGTFSVADAILALSALGFIGFGLQQPAVDWGTMMAMGTQGLINGWWWQIYPVALVFVVVLLCINYIGDALRDVFEVRLRSR